MDTKWPQEFVVKPMNEIVTNTCLKQPNPPSAGPVERKAKPDQVLNCPRCNSLNTKFCYYNNYSLTQPRYFCKDCRRYWTEGGSLRNIPIGGGIRKNKRSSSSSSSKKPLFVHNTPPPPPEIPHEASKVPEFGFSHTHCEPKNLNLSFSQGSGIVHQNIPQFRMKNPPSLVSTSSALELLGISTSRPPFLMPSTSITYSAVTAPPGFGMSYPHQFQEFMRPTSLDGGGEGSIDTNNGKPLMQFESLNLPVSSPTSNSGGNDHEHDEEKETADPGFWNGMLSAGSWQ